MTSQNDGIGLISIFIKFPFICWFAKFCTSFCCRPIFQQTWRTSNNNYSKTTFFFLKWVAVQKNKKWGVAIQKRLKTTALDSIMIYAVRIIYIILSMGTRRRTNDSAPSFRGMLFYNSWKLGGGGGGAAPFKIVITGKIHIPPGPHDKNLNTPLPTPNVCTEISHFTKCYRPYIAIQLK